MKTYRIEEIKDPVVRENFEKLLSELREFPLLHGKFKFFELEFTKAVTSAQVRHSLGFRPKDVIQTSLVGAGTITFNYGDFSSTHLDITTSGVCTWRGFIGTYLEGSNA